MASLVPSVVPRRGDSTGPRFWSPSSSALSVGRILRLGAAAQAVSTFLFTSPNVTPMLMMMEVGVDNMMYGVS